jgi:ribosomal protein L11 methyltransferase
MQKNVICYELKIYVAQDQSELVAQILTELEIGDFIYGEIDCDIEAEYDPSKVTVDLYEKLNENPPIVLYNEDKEFLQSVQSALLSLFPKVNIPILPNTFLIQEIQDQNWRESWKKSFKPVLVKDFFAIIPPWEKPENFSQKHKIIINPGMAFGTGQHETTRLCLELMLKVPVAKRVFDVGTGSGILAIAAKKLGSQFVLGNDIDPECMAVANENTKNNLVDGIIFVSDAISNINEFNFDLIIANIQSRPLKVLIPDILKRATNSARIILSGILVAEKEDFIQFLSERGARVVCVEVLNHWCAIMCEPVEV